MTTQQPQKAGFVVVVSDRERGRALMEAMQIAEQVLKFPLNHLMNQNNPEYQRNVDNFMRLAEEINDKFHEQGWCEDPNCKWKDQHTHDNNTL